MLYNNNVDNKSTHPLCTSIQHSNNAIKSPISSEQCTNDDGSTGSLVDTQPLNVLFGVLPEQNEEHHNHYQQQQHQQPTTVSSHANEPLPKVPLPLKPKVRLAGQEFISNLPDGYRCKQNSKSNSAQTPSYHEQSSLSLPSLPLHSGEDVPDLVSEEGNAADTGASSNPSWPAYTQTPGLKSSLKKPNIGQLAKNGEAAATGPRRLSLSSCSSSTLRKRPTTQRRVRGLWDVDAVSSNRKGGSNTDERFEELRDETVERILSFLDLADICRAGMVGRRWKSIVKNSAVLWKRIDASSFAQKAYETFHNNPDRTGQALEDILKGYKPESLVIRNIGVSLSADTYLPSTSSLKELTLTNFQNITDTHIHVMLLMTMKKKQPNELQVLHLEDCPLLTDGSIRSITATCTKLKRLSLKGNLKMADVSPLAPLLATKEAPLLSTPSLAAAPSAASGPPASLASFQALFAPPATPPRPPMTTPRPSTPTNTTSTTETTALQSLFAAPGTSPPRKKNLMHTASSSSLPSTSNAPDGNLQHLDLRCTNVSAQSFLHCIKKKKTDSSSPLGNRFVCLQSLYMNGDTWTDALLVDLSQVISLEDLRVLSLATSGSKTGGGMLTNKGLKSMARNALRFSKLTTLDFSGHHLITGMGLASFVSHTASPVLERLQIDRCYGVSTDTKGMDRLVKAVVKRNGNVNVKTLRSLHMRGCFMSCTSSSCHPAASQMKEMQCWQRFMDGVAEMSLRHLDVRDCWTTATSIVATLSCDASSTMKSSDRSCSSFLVENKDDCDDSNDDENSKNTNITSIELLCSAVPSVLY